MRKIMLAAVSAAAVLSAGSLMPNRAEAMIRTSAAVNSAEAVAPVENIWWCGWRCHHRFHHRFVFFHHRFHHGFAFAHRCTWC
jgi:hypothetical protein